jgi:hypothetical protein
MARIVALGHSRTIAMADTNTDVTLGTGLAGIFSRSFEQALEQQRSLWEQVSRFARDETYRIGSLQLEHANKALETLHTSLDMPAMIGAQHGLLRDMVREYADQSIRYSEMMRDLSNSAFTKVLDAGYRGMTMGHDAVKAAAEQAEEAVEAIQSSGEAMVEAASEGTSQMVGQMEQQVTDNFGNTYVHH